MIIIKVACSGNDHTLTLNLPGVQCFIFSDWGCIKRDYNMEDWVHPCWFLFGFFLQNEMYVYNSTSQRTYVILERLCPLRVFFAQICCLFRAVYVGISVGGCLGLLIMGFAELRKRKNWQCWWVHDEPDIAGHWLYEFIKQKSLTF